VPDSAFLAAILAGLTGSLHCVAMCGGFAGAGAGGSAPLLPARELARQRIAMQVGRLVTYVALGGALGSLGGAAFAWQWAGWQRGLYVAANVALLLAAASMAGLRVGGPALERAGLAIFRGAAPALTGRARGLRGRFALGLLWGLTPCALIYAVLPLALLSGGPLAGATVMAGLWIGTLPALLAASGAWRMALQRCGTVAVRRVAATAIGGFALLGLYRVTLATDLLANGPFCLVR
jgi:sulfite exporter TauE/SafE